VKVQPFRQYHVSIRIRTKDFKGTPRIVVFGGGRMLNYNLQFVKPTQDWTVHHAVFNSLGSGDVRVAFGCWDGETGEAAFADPAIEETGLVNLIRRPGAPLVVKKNGEPLDEGDDFERVADPSSAARRTRPAASPNGTTFRRSARSCRTARASACRTTTCSGSPTAAR
jgi:hypothetical protein